MTAASSDASVITIEPRLGSRAWGTARVGSDLALLIIVPDHWLAARDRASLPGALWRQSSSHRLPLDLLLYAESEGSQRQQYKSAVTTQAYQERTFLQGWSQCHSISADHPG